MTLQCCIAEPPVAGYSGNSLWLLFRNLGLSPLLVNRRIDQSRLFCNRKNSIVIPFSFQFLLKTSVCFDLLKNGLSCSSDVGLRLCCVLSNENLNCSCCKVLVRRRVSGLRLAEWMSGNNACLMNSNLLRLYRI